MPDSSKTALINAAHHDVSNVPLENPACPSIPAITFKSFDSDDRFRQQI